MTDIRHTIIGLQSSGKTTFAAALWYLIDSREIETTLRKGRHNGDFRYLEEIAASWANGWQVPRTSSDGWQPVRMNLADEDNQEIGLHFVDLSGETFEKIFATREVEGSVEELLTNIDGLLIFVTARRPRDDLTLADMYKGLPGPAPAEEEELAAARPVPFDASMVPHQVQLVDLLDSLADAPISMRPARIVVVVSAWELARNGQTPDAWLAQRMPLLSQYLSSHVGETPFRVYGVSAQGAEIPKQEESENDSGRPALLANRERLLKYKKGGERIVVDGHGASRHDLTHPIRWLSGLEK